MALHEEPLIDHPHLRAGDLDWLRALVGDWQMLADLTFSDLVLWFPHTAEGFVSQEGRSFLALAQARPSTTQTVVHRDVVGDRIRADLKPMVERAWRYQVETNSSDEGRPAPARLRVQAVPLVRGERTLGVMTLHYSTIALRAPSRLELVYQQCAKDLLTMASSGRWPDLGQEFAGYGGAPRVGDGLLRLDVEGTVVFASPNATSALSRLGVSEALEGRSLAGIGAELRRAVGGMVDESEPLMLTGRKAMRAELEAHGSTVTLRSVPLYRAGERFGAIVLCRDVTDLRRRDKQLMSKDATIKEIHHRVKNNLQTVSALLRMQSRRMDSEEGRSGLQRAMRRVETIAIVHDSLSKGLEDSVDVDELMRRQLRLAAEMAESGRQAHTVVEGSFGQLPPDMVTPLALVITEVVANAVEHGFAEDPEHRELQVQMRVRRRTDAAGRQGLELEIVDDGVGIPEGSWSPGLGLQIVQTLVRGELSGTIEWTPRVPAADEAVTATEVGVTHEVGVADEAGQTAEPGRQTAERIGTRVVLRAPILSGLS
ncbi:sensor histidine kinase [Nesterenkonia aerolata]|uniref:histidine kinase n=1 Tax=Nesterenkonia aerolata TaxID=3074079 RepID=A0ABU2DNT8_9MICC|nr:histidine kinase N-terminal domain-containing protein [Nesterenkonia sp. LY-0111]MDR8018098.1 histidine kinase N-terminal domain-containing protein [Nesterenkonia sp. LY-0111]